MTMLSKVLGGGYQATAEVLQADIDKGEREGCYECPVALAVNRLLESLGADGLFARVDACEIIVMEHGTVPVTVARCVTPQKAAWFIFDFDDDEPVEPFSFTVEFEPVAA